MVASVVVGCAADRDWALPLGVMLRSAATHLCPRRDLVAHVLDGGIGERDRERVRRSAGERVRLEWHTPDRSRLRGLPLWGHVSASTYDRLAMGRQLPPEVSRVVWLDCDVLVLDDLAELHDRKAHGVCLDAVQDGWVRTVGSRHGIRAYRALGLDPAAPYFNAGVMCVDLDLWREHEVEERALEYLRRYAEDVIFHDQEALNAVLVGAWSRLPPRWNWSTHPVHTRSTSLGQTKPAIVHFAGSRKPWQNVGSGAWYELFLDHLDRTEWRGQRAAGGPWSRWVGRWERSRVRALSFPLENLWMRLRSRLARRRVELG